MASIFSKEDESSTLMTNQEFYTQITALDNLKAHYYDYLEEEERGVLNGIYQKLNYDLSLDEESQREIDKIYHQAIKRAMGISHE